MMGAVSQFIWCKMHMTQGVFHSLFPKFQMAHEGFSFDGLGKSDEGADTDLLYDFCWPKVPLHETLMGQSYTSLLL